MSGIMKIILMLFLFLLTGCTVTVYRDDRGPKVFHNLPDCVGAERKNCYYKFKSKEDCINNALSTEQVEYCKIFFRG
jgi:hypothetical protein